MRTTDFWRKQADELEKEQIDIEPSVKMEPCKLEMEDQKRIAKIIVNHLKSQLKCSEYSDDSLESLEIAVQCIESAYDFHPTDSDGVHFKLETIIREFYKSISAGPKPVKEPEISQADKDEAECHKKFGNDYMRNQNNEKAIEAYSVSISLNPLNPIYYCNRAAAYNAIGKYKDAIEDCQKAIELDSTYCKAYCRLGLAFTCLKDYRKAVSCYKKACDLDPENIGYQRNYQLTLSNLKAVTTEQDECAACPACTPQPIPAPTSSQIMQTAASLMHDPEVSSVLTDILGDVDQAGGLDRLMHVGQSIVNRLQTSNPALLEGLRMQFETQAVQNRAPKPTSKTPPENENPEEKNAEEKNAEEKNAEEKNADEKNAEEKNAEEKNVEEKNAEEKKPEEKNPEEKNPDEKNAEEKNPEEENSA